MSRIAQTLSRLRRNQEKALILYMTGGDPSLSKNAELIPELARQGVDLIELGIPFSDPVADGPVIQEASTRALKRGTTVESILKTVAKVRVKSEVPIILMGYYNPIFRYGDERFVKEARRSGVDGVIIPDMPLEESASFLKLCRREKLDLIFLVAPTSSLERKKKIAAASTGFLYYVSLTGVTGTRQNLPAELVSDLRKLKRVTRIPVCAGFGISTPEQAKAVAQSADGIIIGSAFVRFLNNHPKASATALAKQFVSPFAKALGKSAHA